MNRTIISIEQTDGGGKEGTIVVSGERNGCILFEEHFDVSAKDNLLNLFILQEELPPDKSLATKCLSKLLNDIKQYGKRNYSKSVIPDRINKGKAKINNYRLLERFIEEWEEATGIKCEQSNISTLEEFKSYWADMLGVGK